MNMEQSRSFAAVLDMCYLFSRGQRHLWNLVTVLFQYANQNIDQEPCPTESNPSFFVDKYELQEDPSTRSIYGHSDSPKTHTQRT